MIELLVAVLVMGVGVLGIAALQMLSLQNNRAAIERAEAVALAYDMLDRIRANPIGDPAGSAHDGLDLEDPPSIATSCLTNSCSEAQMATFDRAVWKCRLGDFNELEPCVGWREEGLLPQQDGLPNGDGAVETIDRAIRVTVQWTGPGGPVQSVVVESQI